MLQGQEMVLVKVGQSDVHRVGGTLWTDRNCVPLHGSLIILAILSFLSYEFYIMEYNLLIFLRLLVLLLE